MVDPVAKAMADSVEPVLAVFEGLTFFGGLLWPFDVAVVSVWRWPHLLDFVVDLLLAQVRKLLVCPETVLLLLLFLRYLR